MPKEITREELWEAGVQYGHQTKRWNPKMAPYIYGTKNRNHIIDLQKTIDMTQAAMAFVESIAKKEGKILFVGTKRNAKPAVKEAALRTGNFFVNNRWLGGTLTNMKTISTRIKTLWNIENDEKTGKLALRTKKEQILIEKEKDKLEKTLGGIKQMYRLPNALFVIDPVLDEIAIKEAKKLHIPVIAICDTNANPDLIDYIIPGNDDLQEAINLLTNYMVDAYAEGAGLKVPPSVLRTKIVRKEYNNDDNNNGDGNNNHGNRNYKPRWNNHDNDGDSKPRWNNHDNESKSNDQDSSNENKENN